MSWDVFPERVRDEMGCCFLEETREMGCCSLRGYVMRWDVVP